jgi:hypothetical protein
MGFTPEALAAACRIDKLLWKIDAVGSGPAANSFA